MTKQAIVAQEEAPPSTEVTPYETGLLDVIARAARDPNVDIDKMERLLEMQERVNARRAKAAFDAALAVLQPDLPVISERGKILDRNGRTQSTYALWEDVNENIRPLLAEHGFALSFKTGRSGDLVTVTGILSHRDGHREETTVELPSDGSGSKNAVQAVGSSTSYGKRYAAFALLNITSKGEDDDGQSATKYQASGEPMPRAKLEGEHPSKTALRNAVNAIIADVRKAKDGAAIDALLKAGRATIKQAEKDWPQLITGDPKIPEDVGLRGAVEQQRAALAGDGVVSTMIETMRQCESLQALYDWMDRNDIAVQELDGAESRRFQTEYEAFEAGLRAAANLRAG